MPVCQRYGPDATEDMQREDMQVILSQMPHRVPDTITAALRRRGITLRRGDGGNSKMVIPAWSASERDRFYRAMQRYSFRLVLRDVIRLGRRGQFSAESLTRHASLEAVLEHLGVLEKLSLVRREAREYSLTVGANSLGPTLEWFVAEVLRRELGFEVAMGIPLRGGRTGGDLDVVAMAEGMFLFVEVKSGPPKHVNATHVASFLERVDALAPHGAIFFEDTELRMADKVMVLFEQALVRRGAERRPQRLQRELFTVGPGIFIANAHPDVITNLTTCVSHLLRQQGLQI